jgi:hypothetical protein
MKSCASASLIAANRRRRAKNSEISRAITAYSNERSHHVGADALKERKSSGSAAHLACGFRQGLTGRSKQTRMPLWRSLHVVGAGAMKE